MHFEPGVVKIYTTKHGGVGFIGTPGETKWQEYKQIARSETYLKHVKPMQSWERKQEQTEV